MWSWLQQYQPLTRAHISHLRLSAVKDLYNLPTQLGESAFVEEMIFPTVASPKNETITACNMLNRMTNLDMPYSERFLVALDWWGRHAFGSILQTANIKPIVFIPQVSIASRERGVEKAGDRIGGGIV
jgi:hypothetical protein